MSYEDDRRRARDNLSPELREIDALLAIWQSHFPSGVRPGADEPEERQLWDRIERARKWCRQ